MADFDPSGSQNSELILMKLGMVDYVWDSTPHDNFGGVVQRGWSGQICHLSHLLSFFFFLFLAFFSALQVEFLSHFATKSAQ